MLAETGLSDPVTSGLYLSFGELAVALGAITAFFVGPITALWKRMNTTIKELVLKNEALQDDKVELVKKLYPLAESLGAILDEHNDLEKARQTMEAARRQVAAERQAGGQGS